MNVKIIRFHFRISILKGRHMSVKQILKNDIDESDLPPKMLRLLTMEDRQILPHQEVIELINLRTGDEKKEVKIGSSLDAFAKKEITDLLKEYVDIFAWFYQDMLGLSTKIVEHQLQIKPEGRPVQQKLRRVKPKMLL